jgi:hypothetical protein
MQHVRLVPGAFGCLGRSGAVAPCPVSFSTPAWGLGKLLPAPTAFMMLSMGTQFVPSAICQPQPGGPIDRKAPGPLQSNADRRQCTD